MAQTEQAITELIVDGRQAFAGAAAIEAAYERAGMSVDKLQAKIDAGAAAQMRLAATGPQSVDRVTMAYQKLAASIDPVAKAQFAAEREMTRSLALIDRAVMLGVTTQVQAATTISRLRQKQLAEIAAIRDAQIAANRVMNDNDAMGGGRRQILGYQAFDVGQGLAAGTPLAIIAAQQGPQIAQLYAAQGGLNALWRDAASLLGGLVRAAGPWLAILAGLYGAYKLLGTFTVDAALAIDDTTAALAAQAAPIGTVQAGIGELARLQKTYQDTIRSTGDVHTAATEKIIANTKREFEARKALLELEAIRQEAALKANQAAIAQEGLALRRSVTGDLGPWYNPYGGSNSVNTRMDLERQGFADPRIGSVPFVRLPDDITGLDRINEIIENSPVFQKLRELRAEGELTRLTFEALQDALKAKFDGRELIKEAPTRTPDGFVLTPDTMQFPGMRGVDDQSGSLQFYEDITKAGRERIRQLDQERSMLGLVGAELAAARYAQEMVNDAIAKNIQLSPEQVAAIKAQAVAIGERTEANMREKLQLDLAFERDQLGRSSIDQIVASRLQSAGLPLDMESDQANAIRMLETLKRVKAEWEDIRDIGRDAIDSIVDSAVTGFSDIEDVIKNIGQDILKEFLNLSIANPLKNAIYGDGLPTIETMGGIGGFLKTLLGGEMPEMARAAATMNVNAGTVVVTGGIGVGGGFNPSASGFMDMLNPSGAANANGGPPMSLAGIGSPGSVPIAATGSIADYIRQAALARGIDPEIALRVARSEGGLTDPFRQGEAMLSYGREESFGPFQLHMRNGGVGVRALAAGIDPRTNWQGGVDFALDEAANKGWGQWFGAAKVGIGDREGLGNARALGEFAKATQQATQNLNGFDAGIGKVAQSLVGGASNGAGGLGGLFGLGLYNTGAGFHPTRTGFMDMLGGASAGGAGSGGILGLIMRMFGLPGFADGGFTGGGGIVHPNEIVWSQDDIRKAGGVGKVEAMRRSGSVNGDYGARGGTSVNVTSMVNNYTSAKVETREEDDGFGGKRIVHTISDQVTSAANTPGSSWDRELRARGAGPMRKRRS